MSRRALERRPPRAVLAGHGSHAVAFDPPQLNVLARKASQRVQYGIEVPQGQRLVFCSGQLGVAPDDSVPEDAGEQAELCFRNIAAVLAEAGLTKTGRVVVEKTTGGAEADAEVVVAEVVVDAEPVAEVEVEAVDVDVDEAPAEKPAAKKSTRARKSAAPKE